MIRFRWLCGPALVAAASLAVPAAAAPTILVLGDSLSAAYGMSEEQGWVSLLEDKLTDNGYPHEVVNASISGDTTRDALSRLEPTLERHRPGIVVVELGGNDGLRAFSIDTIESNLARILETIRENGAKIVLAGIRIPPNYGPVYTDAFEAIYPRLAERFDTALIPFFMQGVAANPDLMQDDGIHPNAAAQPRLLDNVWPVLEPLLEKTGASQSSHHRDGTHPTENGSPTGIARLHRLPYPLPDIALQRFDPVLPSRVAAAGLWKRTTSRIPRRRRT